MRKIRTVKQWAEDYSVHYDTAFGWVKTDALDPRFEIYREGKVWLITEREDATNTVEKGLPRTLKNILDGVVRAKNDRPLEGMATTPYCRSSSDPREFSPAPALPPLSEIELRRIKRRREILAARAAAKDALITPGFCYRCGRPMPTAGEPKLTCVETTAPGGEYFGFVCQQDARQPQIRGACVLCKLPLPVEDFGQRACSADVDSTGVGNACMPERVELRRLQEEKRKKKNPHQQWWLEQRREEG